jgi:paraquat-inducible protein A
MLSDASSLIICEHCDAVYRRRVLARGDKACCRRCGAVLYRHQRLGVRGVLALSLAGLIMWLIANTAPIFTMSQSGVSSSSTLWGAVVAAWSEHVPVVAILVAASLFFIPLMQLLLLSWGCGFVAAGRRPPGRVQVVRILRWLHPWSMIEVLMLGIFVASVKLGSVFDVTPDIGLWGFGLLMVLITLVASWDTHDLWREPAEARR